MLVSPPEAAPRLQEHASNKSLILIINRHVNHHHHHHHYSTYLDSLGDSASEPYILVHSAYRRYQTDGNLELGSKDVKLRRSAVKAQVCNAISSLDLAPFSPERRVDIITCRSTAGANVDYLFGIYPGVGTRYTCSLGKA